MDYRNMIIVKVGEIHLKGLNRPFFEKTLINNMKAALKKFEGVTVSISQSRIFVYNIDPKDLDEALEKLSKIFGIHALSPAREFEKDIDLCIKNAVEMLEEAKITNATFKVKARRADKRFPIESPEIAAKVGAGILENMPNMKVDLHNPDMFIEVEIRDRGAYVYFEDVQAVGGLPIGTNGRAMLLLSGGIDSPVAGYMIAKRGVQLDGVHFYSFPHTSERAKEKVYELAQELCDYVTRLSVFVVPFTHIQEEIYDKCPDQFMTILTRRFMMKISERIARLRNCGALVTGESIGQVASQTMESLNCTDSAVNLPVFRPVIGMDKLEIMEIAKNIGTYETSILPFEDCCTVFTPRHPSTKPKLQEVIKAEQLLDEEALIDEAMQMVERIDIDADGVIYTQKLTDMAIWQEYKKALI
ncbi:MAG: tRNA 4-thiouridine(8) synthase ThiI [Clostridiales bacterium]|nr:tRNA 4-thiouridine(8) synthase ThiI [Clostridiales bacterium]